MIRIDIINDGTGDTEVGNYDVMLYLPGEGETWVRVEGHARADGWYTLLAVASAELERKLEDARAARR